jgi:hypothetical protein
MRRKLFTLVSALSAVLCLVAAVLWVRSYWVNDNWVRDEPGWRMGVGSARGQVAWRHVTYTPGTPVQFSGAPGYQAFTITSSAGMSMAMPGSWSFAGFRGNHFHMTAGRPPGPSGSIVVEEFTVLLWAPLLTTGVFPALWLLLWVRRRSRTPAGCCPNCGYDLRATPDRCPECGAVSAKEAAA